MFFTYVFRELRRRHRQALLTALGLAVGVALVVAVTAYADGVSTAQNQVLQSLYGVGTDITVSQQQKMARGGAQQFDMQPPDQSEQGQQFERSAVHTSPGQQSIATKRLEQIAALDGVGDVTGSIQMEVMDVSGKYAQSTGGSSSSNAAQPPSSDSSSAGSSSQQGETRMSPINVSQLTVSGVDTTSLGLGPLSSAQIASGRELTASDANRKVALVTRAYAKQESLEVGDTKKIDDVKFTIVGIVVLPSGSNSSDLYLPLRWAQKLSDNAGKVNQIYVKADSATVISQVKKEIEALMPKATVTTSSDLASQVSGSLSSASTLADRLGKWLAGAALVAAFAVASLLTVSAVSRRVREFGTLKALGWRGRRIVGQVLGESVVQGVIGAVLGVALGVAGARLIAAFSPALKATLGSAGAQGGPPGMRQAAHTVSVVLTAPVSLQLIGIAVGLALAGALIAGGFGGWRASRLRPADALRRVD
jgi:ABC-type antimicrobial peptide transport system permease subunit